MSIAHNKNPIPLLNFLNKYISAKSTVQTLSMKYECTFRFSNVVTIGLCSYSANLSFYMISFVTEPPAAFSSKEFIKTLMLDLFGIHHV